jgi:hypothetical protein
MNKEEEQIASFKYLRILGSHLKNRSSSPMDCTDVDQMNRKFSQINLSTIAEQKFHELSSSD